MVKALCDLNEFNNLVKNIDVNRLLVVFYTASWCGPCKFMYPLIEELNSRAQHITFIKVDVDNDGEAEETKISSVNGVDCMPTFHFYKNGELIDKLSGADKVELLQKIKLHSIIV